MMLLPIFIITCSLGTTPSLSASPKELTTPSLAKPGCEDRCGNVTIPFPFGIGSHCAVDKWFQIECNTSGPSPKLYLRHSNLEVLNITNFVGDYTGPTNSFQGSVPVTLGWYLYYTDFDIFKKNMSDSGPETTQYCYNESPLQCQCTNGLRGNPYLIDGCSQDINECEEYDISCGLGGVCVNTHGDYHCSFEHKFIFISFGSGLGALLLIFGTWGLYKLLKRRKERRRKKKFFKQNGGLLLQQQLSSEEGNVKKTKLFSSNELTKATDHFSIDRILGQGGQGTVYKGMLEDGNIVAIKKSKVVDE